MGRISGLLHRASRTSHTGVAGDVPVTTGTAGTVPRFSVTQLFRRVTGRSGRMQG